MSLIYKLPKVRGSYREDAILAKTNWFGVGGPAEVLFRPEDVNDLSDFLKDKPEFVPVTVIGVGSNLLVRDGGIDGVVVRLGRGFTDIKVEDNKVIAGAGALSFNVSTLAKSYGLTGLEFLVGIPGSIGGAIAMNAGAYGSEVSTVLIEAEVIDEHGQIHIVKPEDIGFIYRGNTMPDGWIFTRGVFRCESGDPKAIEEKMNEISSKREATQPVKSRTSGSTFVNPIGVKKAWQLIDESGCRGLQIGDATVSTKHCNFLINNGNATAADLELLGETVRKKVMEHSGIMLEWEVKRIGKGLDN
jgi:UDP-N-acetylmuramate dehydrogenase